MKDEKIVMCLSSLELVSKEEIEKKLENNQMIQIRDRISDTNIFMEVNYDYDLMYSIFKSDSEFKSDNPQHLLLNNKAIYKNIVEVDEELEHLPFNTIEIVINKAREIMREACLKEVDVFIDKFFNDVGNKHKEILKAFLINKEEDLPITNRPNYYYNGLVKANCMREDETYMQGFLNLRNLFLKSI